MSSFWPAHLSMKSSRSRKGLTPPPVRLRTVHGLLQLTKLPGPPGVRTTRPTILLNRPASSFTLKVDGTKPLLTSKFHMSTNYIDNQFSGPTSAAGIAVAKTCIEWFSTHLYWFGPGNPWMNHTITEAQMAWAASNNDTRIDKIVNNGFGLAVMMGLTPTWMVTDDNTLDNFNQFDTTYQTSPPTIAHFPDMAEFCRRFLVHYRTRYGTNKVARLCIWNEFKGFLPTTQNPTRYIDLTNLYNDIWDVVHTFNTVTAAADPIKVQVGGLYPPFGQVNQGGLRPVGDPSRLILSNGSYVDPRTLDAMLYFKANAHGFNFVCLDGQNTHTPEVMGWFHTNFPNVPVIWQEFYEGIGQGPTDAQKQAQFAINYMNGILNGVTALYAWQPEAVSSHKFGGQWAWTSTANTGGGVRMSTADIYQSFKDNFSEPTQLYQTDVIPAISGVVAIGSATRAMITNNTANTVTIDGVDILPYDTQTRVAAAVFDPLYRTPSVAATVNRTDLTLDIAVPTGTVNGDLLMMIVSQGFSAANVALPTGWTSRDVGTASNGANGRHQVWTRVASAEPVKYTLDISAATSAKIVTMLCFPVSNGAIDIAVSGNHGDANTVTAHATPSVTMPGAGHLLHVYTLAERPAVTVDPATTQVNQSAWTGATGYGSNNCAQVIAIEAVPLGASVGRTINTASACYAADSAIGLTR